jgi:hypothetical protein
MNLLSEFIRTYGPAYRVKYARGMLPPEEVVQRALSKLGEEEYDLFTNNCEHFAIWCKTGSLVSDQVTKLAAGLVTVGITAVASLTSLYSLLHTL